MDIDKPDPGNQREMTFVVETPVDAETLAFASATEPRSTGTTTLTDTPGSSTETSGPSSQPAKDRELNTGIPGVAEGSDVQMTDASLAEKMELDSGPAHNDGQNSMAIDSAANQDPETATASSERTGEQTPTKPAIDSSPQDIKDSTMSDDSSVTNSGGDKSESEHTSDSSLGGSDVVMEGSANSDRKGTADTLVTTDGGRIIRVNPGYISYLPPQPYGHSPYYPPVVIPSTIPLPSSPTISYASVTELDELRAMNLAGVDLSSQLNSEAIDKVEEFGRLQQTSNDVGSLQGPAFTSNLGNTFYHSSAHENDPVHFDLLPRIKGLFRLLDLYTENTSSGLVDKTIICQDSLGKFINTILPGAYSSVTKIDFNRLDREVRLPLVGIYGSKSEIVRLLKEAGSIDDDVAGLLQLPEDVQIQTHMSLRSGIYLLDPPNSHDATSTTPPTRYVIYWPEASTWDESQSGNVRKNRVTFMRYLTCLTDQIRCLISPEHTEKLALDSDDSDSDDDAFGTTWDNQDDDGVNDRFFKFEVAKTNEQEEGAEVRDGFKLEDRRLAAVKAGLPNGRSWILEPRLLSGETTQAFSTLKLNQGMDKEDRIDRTFNPYSFRYELSKYRSIVISDTIDESDLGLLLEKGELTSRLPPDTTKSYNELIRRINARAEEDRKRKVAECLSKAKENQPKLEGQVRLYLINQLLKLYTYLDWETLLPAEKQPSDSAGKDPLAYFNFVSVASTSAKEALHVFMTDTKLDVVSSESYKRLKRPFLIVRNILDKHANHLTEEQRLVLADAVIQDDPSFKPSGGGWKTAFNPIQWGKALTQKLGITNEDQISYLIKTHSQVDDEPDPEFLSSLANTTAHYRSLSESADRLKRLATEGLRQKLEKSNKSLALKLNTAHERHLKQHEEFAIRTQKETALLEAYSMHRQKVRNALDINMEPRLRISSIKPSSHWGYPNDIAMSASTRVQIHPTISVSLYKLDISDDDRQRMRDDPQYVPLPRISTRPQFEQKMPLNWVIRRVQMLNTKRCLLVIDCPDKTRIWIFSPASGLNPNAPTYEVAPLHGQKYVIAVDEQKNIMTFIVMTQTTCVLQQFLIDPEAQAIHGKGSPFNLLPWYDDAVPDISHAAFFSGTDDLCLVQASGQVRILSLAQQNFRPATVQLEGRPLFVRSSPDGTALLVIEGRPEPTSLRIFHRASFGSNPSGIVKALPDSFFGTKCHSITSVAGRGDVFVLGLDPSHQVIRSVRVEISKKETEYQFRAKQQEGLKHQLPLVPANNVMVTCISEVWERFPVLASIQRETISAETRAASSVTFVCDSPSLPFAPYFRRMVRTFQETSKKPTGNRLASIHISSSPFEDLEWEAPSSSNFKGGEWVVELLCLIPIHIAVADENRFIPLKDGVRDPAMERELLGAEVSRIIDSISLGWYESILSVYMASKEVKVISSMGEQSVGKSYSLNHVIDSSFAGSAVRTTEGVWMSICPTRDFLVVALDFEGVHSIERTPQEDMLLVLFNTAISNLVMFRNNFALSRDVANMFTSFQASTHLFNPKSNPKLFKGLIAIVIKDVVDADKKDIVKEFSSKFSQIVSKEQAANFITVLHNSQLTVIPWSVILSADFYRLFGKLSKTLLNQKTTHNSGGEFLITLKTLMAKMKAQDWGSLDQTVIKHRVNALVSLLPSVLSFGRLGARSDGEELKNMDNQSPIIVNDTSATFYLGTSDTERAEALARLVDEWKPHAARHSTQDLVNYLKEIAEQRIATGREWINQNVSRFPEDNADMRALKRRFGELSEVLSSNVQLCLAQCQRCRLRCMFNRSHAFEDHDCRTSHQCITPCDYVDDHMGEENCGLPAGHSGRHICDPSAHLCGEPCHLSARRGCQGHCTKPTDDGHTDHACAAQVHLCGEACDLQGIVLPNGGRFSCTLPCARPYDEPHTRHECDNRLTCPLKCELCSRLCAMGSHLHGLDPDALHLCGQSHNCQHKCEAAGICEINTTPHSVETTFTGRHSTFSYTKYTQVAKRLDCAVAVLPGERTHPGPHLHSNDPAVFHFCETRCLSCGYFCTLSRDHPHEHNTAHGSMELTAWAVEGNADSVAEVQGRKFAARETGAPQLCSSICRSQGRHAHIDYCCNLKGECRDAESEHIHARMEPNPDRPKDWISHREFWARAGFMDPYSNAEQAEFAKCNVQCAGPEHEATAGAPARPSFCNLPIFHPPQLPNWSSGPDSYISTDGHSFGCPNPNNMRQAFHVIFVLDRSGSMGSGDRRPLPGQPVTATISRYNNNRFGAVMSAVYGFWVSRVSGNQSGRRDAYSVITFDGSAQVQYSNDLNSTPDQLLNAIVQERTRGGTNFDEALRTAQTTMESHWSTERSPVLIFLSDGECGVSDNVIHDICNRAVARGKPLSFHSVSFGLPRSSSSLRKMVSIAERVAQNAPADPLNPLVPCGYTDVMDTIRLAETFLNIADSLKKPRAALLRSK